MLTSYLVKCPHFGCHWFGSLLPSNDVDSWHGSFHNAAIVIFECPSCHNEWRARMVGDDVEALPHEAEAVPWA